MATYRITVVTGPVANAGTDANVWITMFGKLGNSGERFLDNAANNFERAHTDVFGVDARDLGELKRVRIRHDNTGHKPGWYLDKIHIQNEQSGKEWVFPCNRWLAFDEDDGAIDRVLNLQ